MSYVTENDTVTRLGTFRDLLNYLSRSKAQAGGTRIESISLGSNSENVEIMSAEELREFIEFFRDNQVTKSLHISNCDLSHEFTEGLVRIINSNLLTNLQFENLRSSDEDWEILCNALKTNASIERLDFAPYFFIDQNKMRLFSEALKENKGIKILEIKNNTTNQTLMILADALKVNQSITTLNISHNKIGLQGAIAIADALKVNTSITKVNLTYDEIGPQGAIAIADALKVNTSITKVNLTSNEIGPQGAIAITDALKVNTSITTLDISNNKIGDVGISEIIDVIAIKDNLHELHAADNDISAVGLDGIEEKLISNQNLHSLNLSSNPIGNAGAAQIARILAHNNNIHHLRLSSCQILSEGATAIAEALKTNSGLRVLHLLFNNIVRDDSITALAEAFKINKSLRICAIESYRLSQNIKNVLADAIKDSYITFFTGYPNIIQEAVDANKARIKALVDYKSLGYEIGSAFAHKFFTVDTKAIVELVQNKILTIKEVYDLISSAKNIDYAGADFDLLRYNLYSYKINQFFEANEFDKAHELISKLGQDESIKISIKMQLFQTLIESGNVAEAITLYNGSKSQDTAEDLLKAILELPVEEEIDADYINLVHIIIDNLAKEKWTDYIKLSIKSHNSFVVSKIIAHAESLGLGYNINFGKIQEMIATELHCDQRIKDIIHDAQQRVKTLVDYDSLGQEIGAAFEKTFFTADTKAIVELVKNNVLTIKDVYEFFALEASEGNDYSDADYFDLLRYNLYSYKINQLFESDEYDQAHEVISKLGQDEYIKSSDKTALFTTFIEAGNFAEAKILHDALSLDEKAHLVLPSDDEIATTAADHSPSADADLAGSASHAGLDGDLL